jgi:hypothetical protein
MNKPPRFEIGLKNGLRLSFFPQHEALVIEIQQGADEPLRMTFDGALLDAFLTVLNAPKREGQ